MPNDLNKIELGLTAMATSIGVAPILKACKTSLSHIDVYHHRWKMHFSFLDT